MHVIQPDQLPQDPGSRSADLPPASLDGRSDLKLSARLLLMRLFDVVR